jgi:MFS family permease
MPDSLRPLSLQPFRHLALARFVDELGDWLAEVALAVLVFDRTGSPLAVAGLFLALQFGPALATPAVVARLDSLPARRTLAVLNLAQAAALVALAALTDSFSLAAVIALAGIAGTLAVSTRALTRATAAAVLGPVGLVREGNGVLNLGFVAGAACGPALGGLLVAHAGVQTALYGDAASFVCVSALIGTARRLPGRQPGAAAGWMARLREGFDYVRARPALSRLLAAQAVAMAFFAAVIPVEIAFAKETLGASDAGYGALLASWGAGMVVGGALFAAMHRIRLERLLLASTLMIGCAYVGTAAAPTLLVACVVSAAGGLGNGVQWVTAMTAAQGLTDTSHQARVIALLESVASAMPGIGFVAGGAIAALLSPRAAYAVAGAGVLMVVALAGPGLARLLSALPRPGARVRPDLGGDPALFGR